MNNITFGFKHRPISFPVQRYSSFLSFLFWQKNSPLSSPSAPNSSRRLFAIHPPSFPLLLLAKSFLKGGKERPSLPSPFQAPSPSSFPPREIIGEGEEGCEGGGARPNLIENMTLELSRFSLFPSFLSLSFLVFF